MGTFDRRLNSFFLTANEPSCSFYMERDLQSDLDYGTIRITQPYVKNGETTKENNGFYDFQIMSIPSIRS